MSSTEMAPATPSHPIDSSESELMAAFALGLTLAEVPPEVIEQAKGHFLDVLGIALASSQFDFGKSVLDTAQEFGAGNEARALGSGTLLPATSAALVNGTFAHGLDFDDTHIAGIYHASAPAFAAALASGEKLHADGRSVLLAYIVALEIGCRLAVAASGAFHERGFHPTALCGTFAAAAAAARLHGDSAGALVSALGVCGSQASGILELRESWLKRLHPGWSAHAGLIAAALGRHGFKGPRTVFEGVHGFYAAHIGSVPADEHKPSHRLREQWLIPGIALKPYPCCHFIHAFVDAALGLCSEVDVNDIERIDCFLSKDLRHMVAEPRERCIRPQTIYDSLFSVHYVVAVALVKGRVDLAAFYDEPLDDPAVLRLAAQTFCHEDPHSDFPKHFPGEVRITLKSGRTLARREATSSGTPDRRLSKPEINAKFMKNAARAIGEAQAMRVLETVWELEKLSDIGELVSICIKDNGERK
jgi:2-methylcitrate dehydratase PrpD